MRFEGMLTVVTDRATIWMLCTVLVIDIYATYRATMISMHDKGSESACDRLLRENIQTLEGASVYLAPLALTLVLLTVHNFPRAFGELLLFSTTISATFGAIFCVWPVSRNVVQNLRRRGVSFGNDVDKPITVFAALFAIGVVSAWLVSGHWVLNNMLCTFCAVLFATVCRIRTMRSVAVLYCGLVFYDVFFVYCSGPAFGSNFMTQVAKQRLSNPERLLAEWLRLPVLPVRYITLPVMIVVPQINGTGSVLGLGDVLLPIVFIVYLREFDNARGHHVLNGLCSRAIVAHVFAVLVAFCVCFAFHAPQPALLFIAPVMLAVVALSAARIQALGTVWNGLHVAGYVHIADGGQSADKQGLSLRV